MNYLKRNPLTHPILFQNTNENLKTVFVIKISDSSIEYGQGVTSTSHHAIFHCLSRWLEHNFIFAAVGMTI